MTIIGMVVFYVNNVECDNRVALEVLPERMAMPADAGTVDPFSYLPSDKRELYARLARDVLPEDLWEPTPVSCRG